MLLLVRVVKGIFQAMSEGTVKCKKMCCRAQRALLRLGRQRTPHSSEGEQQDIHNNGHCPECAKLKEELEAIEEKRLKDMQSLQGHETRILRLERELIARSETATSPAAAAAATHEPGAEPQPGCSHGYSLELPPYATFTEKNQSSESMLS